MEEKYTRQHYRNDASTLAVALIVTIMPQSLHLVRAVRKSFGGEGSAMKAVGKSQWEESRPGASGGAGIGPHPKSEYRHIEL